MLGRKRNPISSLEGEMAGRSEGGGIQNILKSIQGRSGTWKPA
jgi:hypothetical protein